MVFPFPHHGPEGAVGQQPLVEALGPARVAGGGEQQEHCCREERQEDAERAERHEERAAEDQDGPHEPGVHGQVILSQLVGKCRPISS
jgi:hypothetical protein